MDELSTHGGSLRIYAKHIDDTAKPIDPNIKTLIAKENSIGMTDISYYQQFQDRANQVKYALLSFLIEQKRLGKKIAGYGAAAKGNTMINYCGIKRDMIDFVADASPHKQGKYLPGSHIPALSKEAIKHMQPDFVLILPWNIQEEIMEQLAYIREWGGKFVLAIPELQVL